MVSQDIFLAEKSLLRGSWDDTIPEPLSPALHLAKLACSSQFREVLTSAQARPLFRTSSHDVQFSFNGLFNNQVLAECSAEDELSRFVIATVCLQAFVQGNWTGPDLDVHSFELLKSNSDSTLQWDEKTITAEAVAELALGGEPAYHLAEDPAFLRFSQLLISLRYEHLSTVEWWKLRIATVHLCILDEPVALQYDFKNLLKPLAQLFADDPDLLGRLYLEKGLLEHHLSQDQLASDDFVQAARSTGLKYELTGALGKRTKFQITEHSQLVLLAESHLVDKCQDMQDAHSKHSTFHVGQSSTTPNVQTLPQTLPLNDDTLLEQTAFTFSHREGSRSQLRHLDPSAQPPLHPLDQCILLSLCLNVRNTSPSHGLTTEQMNPYVSRVISHPRNWSIHSMALLLRSRLESSRTRTVERSTLQLQALIDQMPTSDSKTAERLLYFYSIPLPSKWEMEKELAERYLSLGVVKSALQIFERLEMWEDVVKCYGTLEQREKGIGIVRDLLEGRKEEANAVLSRGKASSSRQKLVQDAAREAKFWCLLGDLEPHNAAEHYLKAWSTSKETSGRAMRSLGGYYFARGKYEEAIVSLEKAVRINPLLSRSWFILGCACMRVERWENARSAFSRCVALDEEDGESWNNLASMYLRLGEPSQTTANNVEGKGSPLAIPDENTMVSFENKMLAFRALKQGLKHNYENWRMWHNYMIVSMDAGELQETCRALGRVVEQTADKVGSIAVDEDVLDRLVNAVTRAPANAEEAQTQSEGMLHPNEGHGLYRSVLSLFERTLLPRLSSSRIFRAYARLLFWQGQWEDAIKAYLDGYRCSAAGTIEKGEVDTEKWRAAVVEVEDIVDILRNFGPRVEGYKWRLQGRSIVRIFMGRTKDFEDEPEWDRLTNLQEELRKDEQ
ncbi:tetratricopeptide repeat domain 27 [Crepidotus variabilis]|uniref:Tetratricopeptide repeat domain 27 n=1 Tax=Crepidotus variabilis TaxID=179855 RepID=A0A9P6EFP3_9AGAR|nr:tetratricopeptide repeat domain 27 [Crepidotus variabilis]